MEFTQLILWTVFLFGSLFILVRGSSLFLVGAKQVGLSSGLSPFIIGVLIVGFGTSLPELASSIAGVLQGAPEIVVANVVGSNITNILLIVGLLSVLAGKILIAQDLIKTELTVFFIAAVHFVLALHDGWIDRLEALLLLGTFGAYLWYIFAGGENEEIKELQEEKRTAFSMHSVFLMLLGMAGVLFGAHFAVDMTLKVAEGLSIPVELVSILAIAVGTSLPELSVALQALKTKDTELAIGSIFGSNTFNALAVIGIPALLAPLPADTIVMEIGLPVMIAATIILFVIGLSRQIMRWEGVMMLLFFGFFLVKLSYFI
jgi:cation:H+ antiporter